MNVDIKTTVRTVRAVSVDGTGFEILQGTLAIQVMTVEGTPPSSGQWDLTLEHAPVPFPDGIHDFEVQLDAGNWTGRGKAAFAVPVVHKGAHYTRTIIQPA